MAIASGWYSAFLVVIMFSCLIYILLKSMGGATTKDLNALVGLVLVVSICRGMGR